MRTPSIATRSLVIMALPAPQFLASGVCMLSTNLTIRYCVILCLLSQIAFGLLAHLHTTPYTTLINTRVFKFLTVLLFKYIRIVITKF